MLPAAGRGQGSRVGAPPSAAKTCGGANASIAMPSNIVGKKEFFALDICCSSLPLVDAIGHGPYYCCATVASVSRLTSATNFFPGDATSVRTRWWWPPPKYQPKSRSWRSRGCSRACRVTPRVGPQARDAGLNGVARALGLPQDKVQGIWVPGAGSYGRNDAGDAGIDAALLSKAVGRPVRVQGMRYEGHGWDPKGPASIHRARAALDKEGLVIGYVLESKGFSRIDIDTNESDPSYSLAGQLMGLPLKSLPSFGIPAESYGFAR